MRLLALFGFVVALLAASQASLAAPRTYPVTFSFTINGATDAALARDVDFFVGPTRSNDYWKDMAFAKLDGPGQLQLPAGAYSWSAKLGLARVDGRFVVDGPMNYAVTIPIGVAKLSLYPKNSTKPISGGIEWKVYHWSKNVSGQRMLITTSTSDNPVLMLPTGWYSVEATHDGRTTRHSVELTNGIQYDYWIEKR